MKHHYKNIENAQPGDIVSYKIGHRFTEKNMAPCIVNYSGYKITSVSFNGSDTIDKTSNFYINN